MSSTACICGLTISRNSSAGIAVERYVVGRRRNRDGDEERLGSRRGRSVIVKAQDGIELYAEIDEPSGNPGTDPLTVVFCHGYALNLDCWHFQRNAFRGLVRSVYFDQRGHGDADKKERTAP